MLNDYVNSPTKRRSFNEGFLWGTITGMYPASFLGMGVGLLVSQILASKGSEPVPMTAIVLLIVLGGLGCGLFYGVMCLSAKVEKYPEQDEKNSLLAKEVIRLRLEKDALQQELKQANEQNN